MKIALALSVALCCCLTACHSTTTNQSKAATATESKSDIVRTADFDTLTGETWRGTLTYLDYTSNKPTSIRSTLRVTAKEPGVWLFATGYDDEPHADGASEVRIVDVGKSISNDDTMERVVSRVERDGGVEIITEHAGEDNEQKATIRREYIIGKGSFSIRKLVKIEGEPDFFQRHEYSWKR